MSTLKGVFCQLPLVKPRLRYNVHTSLCLIKYDTKNTKHVSYEFIVSLYV